MRRGSIQSAVAVAVGPGVPGANAGLLAAHGHRSPRGEPRHSDHVVDHGAAHIVLEGGVSGRAVVPLTIRILAPLVAGALQIANAMITRHLGGLTEYRPHPLVWFEWFALLDTDLGKLAASSALIASKGSYSTISARSSK